MNSYRDSALPAIGRLLMSLIFVMGGYAKLSGTAGLAAMIAAKGLPLPELGAWVAVAVELLGGLAILVGFQTRAAAAILCAWCLVTAGIFHYIPADRNMMIHFMKNIAMAGGFLQIVAFGAGAWSVDALLARRHGPAGALRAAE